MIASFKQRFLTSLWAGVFSILLLCPITVFSQESILTGSDGEDIAGPVKSVRFEESWYETRDGKRELGERYLTQICHYYPNGDIREWLFFAGEDHPTGRWIRERDDSGKLVWETKYKDGGRIIARAEYRYDASGKCRETLLYHHDGILDKRIEHHGNEKGQVVENHVFIGDELKTKTVFTYDEKGNRDSYTDYGQDGTAQVKEIYIYNEKSQLTQSLLMNRNNELMATMTYLLDDQGRRSEIMAHGRDNRLEMRRIYHYDNRGNLSELISYGRNGLFLNRQLFHYEYDERGNWIEKNEFTARLDSNYQNPERTVYRIITYEEPPAP